MKIRARFTLKTLLVLVALFAAVLCAYSQLLPQWHRYKQLQAAIRFSPGNSFVPLDPVVVNLSSQSLTRYLRVKIALQVSHDDALIVAQLVDDNKVALRDWLITHLAGKTVDEVRGSDGLNQLRDEISEQFRNTLFSSRDATLQRVVFEEFNVQ